MPRVVVVAGPNGAGKSTVAPHLVRDLFGVTEYVDADAIALGLSRFASDRAAIAAGRVLLARVRALAELGQDLAFETTLATRGFAPWLASLRARGVEVHVVFLALPSPDLAVARVAGRIRLGGHSIPLDVIRRRFERGRANLEELYAPLATSSHVISTCDVQPSILGGARQPGAGAPDAPSIARAMSLGVRDALRKHALYGVPAAIWRDGKVVLVPAQELLDSPEFRALDGPR